MAGDEPSIRAAVNEASSVHPSERSTIPGMRFSDVLWMVVKPSVESMRDTIRSSEHCETCLRTLVTLFERVLLLVLSNNLSRRRRRW